MAETSRRSVLVATILAVSMTTIDQTIVAICAPQIQTSLDISHNAIQWAVNAYILATAASFAFGGRVADIVGQKKMMIVGVAGFAVTSLLCSLAPHGSAGAAWLIVARVLQGISGGLMFPARPWDRGRDVRQVSPWERDGGVLRDDRRYDGDRSDPRRLPG